MVLSDLIERIRGEGLDTPGVRLDAPQARRLWDLDRRASGQLLRHLIEDRVLPGGEQGAQPRVKPAV